MRRVYFRTGIKYQLTWRWFKLPQSLPHCVSPKIGMNKSLLDRVGISLYHADSSPIHLLQTPFSLPPSLARSSQASYIKGPPLI